MSVEIKSAQSPKPTLYVCLGPKSKLSEWHTARTIDFHIRDALQIRVVKCDKSLIAPLEEGIGSEGCWLSGPAGVGKSAIAQAPSEDREKERNFVTSFSFLRNQHRRNVSTSLFLTITYGLASSVPELQDHWLQSSLGFQFLGPPCRWLEGQGEWAAQSRVG
ncbi:hypothetical protein L218DRAFT_947818 [Marasmius fiardii PR-910]|nr:hypothetical protein L218DRAFT_947818 [Marasmius fiardii PR-910]